MTSPLNLCKLWTYNPVYGAVSPERWAICPPSLVSFQPLSLTLIRLHPSLAFHQHWLILLLYYSPEVGQCWCSSEELSCAVFFLNSPTNHFTSQPRSKGNEGGRTRRRGREGRYHPRGGPWRNAGQQRHVMERGEWDTWNSKKKKNDRKTDG